MQEGGDLPDGGRRRARPGSAAAAGGGGGGSGSDDGRAGGAGRGGGGTVADGLQVKLAPAVFRQDEFELYKAYQAAIHDRSPTSYTPTSYCSFLVESPLPPPADSWGGVDDGADRATTATPPCGYGTFHARYELDGSLIAVAVLDILPRSVSSVYLFYSPAYGHLSLGSLSALQEIAHTATLAAVCPDLRYYYMGFYIHGCPKMAYKGAYVPSELLCEATRTWVPLPDAVRRLGADGRAPVDVRPVAGAAVTATAAATAAVTAATHADMNAINANDVDFEDGRSDEGDSGGCGRGAVVRLTPPDVPAVPAPVLDAAALAAVWVVVFVRGGCVRLRLGEVEPWAAASAAAASGGGGGGGRHGGGSRRPPAAPIVAAAVARLRRDVAAFAAKAGVAVASSAAYVFELEW